MEAIYDGGPAFPILERGAGGLELTSTGMSQRALFAAILMHSELTTCGVPGEACEALVKAAAEAGREVEDQMALNAVQCADALLRALQVEPKPRYRDLSPSEEDELRQGRTARVELERVIQDPGFSKLDSAMQTRIRGVLQQFDEEDDIPF